MNSVDFDGVVLIDKPGDRTSHDVVDNVRDVTGLKQIGHAGILDQMATGLLVLLVGRATKLSDFILNADKGYHARVQLGIETDSLDISGKILTQMSVDLPVESIRKAVHSLSGLLELPVPAFSAIKVKGRPLHQYARSRQKIDLPRRSMNFYEIDILDIGSDFVEVAFRCSKGSYVRSWALALGQRLGVPAVVGSLRRTYSAPYNLSDALTLDQFSQTWTSRNWGAVKGMVSLSECLPQWKTFRVLGRDQRLMRDGQIPLWLQQRLLNPIELKGFDGVKVVDGHDGHLLALIAPDEKKVLRIKRVFSSYVEPS